MNVPLNIDWQQILLHLLNFVILFAILYFLLYNPVKKFMDERREYFKKLDDEAKSNLAASEKVKNEYAEKIKSADAQIEQKMEEAQRYISETTAKSMISAKQEAEAIVSNAYKKAENERSRIIRDAQAEIAGMVTDATEKLVLKSGTSESYEQFLTAVEGGGDDE